MESRRWAVDGHRFLDGSYDENLWVPTPFALSYFNSDGEKDVTMATRDAFPWPVAVRTQMGSTYFGKGWPDFWKKYDLCIDDGLVFTYEEEGHFFVNMFNKFGEDKDHYEPFVPVVECSQLLAMRSRSEATLLLKETARNDGLLGSLLGQQFSGKELAAESNNSSNNAAWQASSTVATADNEVLQNIQWQSECLTPSLVGENEPNKKSPVLPNLNAEPDHTLEDFTAQMLNMDAVTSFTNSDLMPLPVSEGIITLSDEHFQLPNLNFTPPNMQLGMAFPWPNLTVVPDYTPWFAQPIPNMFMQTSMPSNTSPHSPIQAAFPNYGASSSSHDQFINYPMDVTQEVTPTIGIPIVFDQTFVHEEVPAMENEVQPDNESENDEQDIENVSGLPDGWENCRVTDVKIRPTAVKNRYLFTIPAKFGKAQLQIGDHQRLMKIRDEPEKTWKVICRRATDPDKTTIAHGWRTFATKNGFKPTEMWNIEVPLNDPEIWIWRKLPQ